ncbi:hypothetical protein BC833DRAFT_520566 [Globomyces pollinis-pini]|nr:hypothetical protein BC833DRAFT_520566 [Globomyces pollinis-pini]
MDSQSKFGLSGLRNLGNTCFMNSIVQCLSATIPLSRYFLGGSFKRHIAFNNPLGSKGSVANQYASLIKSMWSCEESVFVPSEFKVCMGSRHGSFAGSEQQDSQEFLAFLLDQLHEDLNVAKRPFPPNGPELDSEDYSEYDFMTIEWQRYKARNWSIIVDMFQGTLKSMLKCMTCGKTSTTYNSFMYLTLPIPARNRSGTKNGPVTLQECLEIFLEGEIMDGDDAWHCPRCKKPRKTSKILSIVKFPTILLIHLKRFSFQGPFRDKLDTNVDFPISNMNMTPYIKQFAQPESYYYDLYAVSNHFGTLSGGHYTAQVKHQVNDTWYNMDDSRTSEISEREVKSNAAYLLFYCRTGQQSMSDWWRGHPEND